MRFIRIAILALVAELLLDVTAFDKPFIPTNSTPYNPMVSSTFQRTRGRFALSYADKTHLNGYVGQDVVQLGAYYTLTKFGCITFCNSPDFNGVDGILGFGLPSVEATEDLPRPLFYALTDHQQSGRDYHQVPTHKFAFLSTEKAAELQLGGYDPRAVTGSMFFVETIGSHDFSVRVKGLKYGDKELLHFADGYEYIPGIVDSGTSCLVIPDSTLGGRLDYSAETPYHYFKKHASDKATFRLSIDGHWVEIPWEVWYLQDSQQTCVQRTPPMFPGILIGDVLFRKYLVQFDLTDKQRPILGIAMQNPTYSPVQMVVDSKYPMTKLSTQHIISEEGGSRLSQTETLSRIPVYNKQETQYEPAACICIVQSQLQHVPHEPAFESRPNNRGVASFVVASLCCSLGNHLGLQHAFFPAFELALAHSSPELLAHSSFVMFSVVWSGPHLLMIAPPCDRLTSPPSPAVKSIT